MQSSDFMTVLSCHEQASVDNIYETMQALLHGCDSPQHGLECIRREVSRLIPCVIDEFARLRYTSFFFEKLLPKMDTGGGSISEEFICTQGMEHAGTLHLNCLLALHEGKEVSDLLQGGRNDLEIFSTLCAAALLESPLTVPALFKVAGRSVYIDSLIRHIMRKRLVQWNRGEVTAQLRKFLQGCRERKHIFRLFLDIAAEHTIPTLTEGEAADLLRRYTGNVQSELSLLRYIGENGLRGLLPRLYSVYNEREADLPVLYGIVDVLAQLGSEREIEILEGFQRKAVKKSHQEKPAPFVEFLEASLKELKQKAGEPRRAPKGPTLLQCMFYGDVLLPGQAGGGGLTTFLNSLGSNLAAGEEWEAVYTFVFLPMEHMSPPKPLVQESGDHHFVVRIPVSFPSTEQSRGFSAYEYEITRSVRRTLERYHVDPDLFHLRYSDNASRGVMALAKQLEKKVVFTLTPDPHRNFVDMKGNFVSLSDETTIRDMNKVFITDSIVENADGLVLIGHHRKNDQILPYFPQLWLDRHIRKKPLRIIAEGVRTSFSYMGGTTADTYIDLLFHHEGRYRLERSALGRPLILNVGRLYPLKGQHHLLEAWAGSDLSDRYNLVLIGGNVEDPDPLETEILQHIDRCLEEHRHLRGRFCHVPALPNPKVRLLERSIIECIRGPYPNVYVCSSFKEEFGISILEAMVSGFLAIAPQNGGVYSYIENGKTGFLIHTENADAIRKALERVLDPQQYTAEKLQVIASRGMKLVKETFNIKRIAGDFSDYYQSLMKGQAKG